MGDNLVPVDLGQGALDVVAGDVQSCARLMDRSLKCWGTWAFIKKIPKYPNTERFGSFCFFCCVCEPLI